jgi:integrase/recombinase XerD
MPNQYHREPLTQTETSTLADACESSLEKIIVWTLLDTGLRVSELASLDRDDLDFKSHRLLIFGKAGRHGTEGKDRIVPMTDRISPLLEAYFSMNETFGYTERHIHRIVKRVASRAKIERPVSPRVLRDTFAVDAIQEGLSLPALQRILGHESLTTTATYLNISPEDAFREFKRKL